MYDRYQRGAGDGDGWYRVLASLEKEANAQGRALGVG